MGVGGSMRVGRLRRLAAVFGMGLLAGSAVLGVSSVPAGAATGGCAGPVGNLQEQVNALVAPVRNEGGSADGKAANELRGKLTALFATAMEQHPVCRSEIQQVAVGSGASGADPSARGKPFLGPIGWLWNNIYYRVFQGNTVMMVIFGWELFLAPVILVLSGIAVLRGVGRTIYRPPVPNTPAN